MCLASDRRPFPHFSSVPLRGTYWRVILPRQGIGFIRFALWLFKWSLLTNKYHIWSLEIFTWVMTIENISSRPKFSQLFDASYITYHTPISIVRYGYRSQSIIMSAVGMRLPFRHSTTRWRTDINSLPVNVRLWLINLQTDWCSHCLTARNQSAKCLRNTFRTLLFASLHYSIATK